jgi:CheY-like chemotaxis protein
MKQKILAIDDSLTLREFIQRSLTRQSADYTVILAKDGTEGLNLSASEQPDLILLDFILPDMKGDEVCRRLQSDKRTAGLPVVLMSSSAADIKRTQNECENVVKAIAKPFTPDLLCSTVSHSLREAMTTVPEPPVDSAASTAPVPEPAQPAATVKPGVKILGNTRQFSLISVLLALEQDQLSGVLRISTDGSKPIELYLASGHPVLVTLRDPAAYLRCSGYKLTPKQIQAAAKIGGEQTKTGTPLFMQFSAANLMPQAEAVALCQRLNLAIFAQFWTAPAADFAFEAHVPLPPETSALPPYQGAMSEWAMESLRLVGDDYRFAMAWGEPTGIPAYTRKGYERIQQIPLNDEELAFASAISPTQSLAKIAAAMSADVDQAQRILHRFLCLEIFDYWPASLLLTA